MAEIGKLPQSLGQFYAIIGCRVLMYKPDAFVSIKSLLPCLKNKGLVVFQESDSMVSFQDVDLMPLPLLTGRLKIQIGYWLEWLNQTKCYSSISAHAFPRNFLCNRFFELLSVSILHHNRLYNQIFLFILCFFLRRLCIWE